MKKRLTAEEKRDNDRKHRMLRAECIWIGAKSTSREKGFFIFCRLPFTYQ